MNMRESYIICYRVEMSLATSFVHRLLAPIIRTYPQGHKGKLRSKFPYFKALTWVAALYSDFKERPSPFPNSPISASTSYSVAFKLDTQF